MKPLPQYLRGFAALFVLLHHASVHISQSYKIDLLAAIGDGNALAYVGVNLFFALSGYLMASIVPTGSVGMFVWHRVSRIYPAFFLAVVVALGLSWMFSGELLTNDWRNLTLLPLKTYGPLQVEWTLNYEITFYILTSAFCIPALKRLHFWFLSLWAIVILVNVYAFHSYGTSQFPAFYEVPISTWSLSFVLGGLAYYGVSKAAIFRSITKKSGPFCLAAAIAFGLFGVRATTLMIQTLPFLLALAVAYSFTVDFRWRSDLLMRLGDRSYGLYLIHQTTCAFAIAILAPHISSPYVMFGVLVVLSLHVGSILGDADLACYRLLKKMQLPRLKVGPASSTIETMERSAVGAG